jgi:hypothetical protein
MPMAGGKRFLKKKIKNREKKITIFPQRPVSKKKKSQKSPQKKKKKKKNRSHTW